MAAYLADKAQPGIPPKFVEIGESITFCTFIAAQAFGVGDTVTLGYAAPSTFLNAISVDASGIDTAAGFTFSVGQPGTPAQFIVGGKQSGGGVALQGINVSGALGLSFPAQTMPEIGYPIVLTVTAAATTPTNGGIIVARLAVSADK